MHSGWLFKTSIGFNKQSNFEFEQLSKEEQTQIVLDYSKRFEQQISNLIVRLKSFTVSLTQDVIEEIEEELERVKENFGLISRLKESYKIEDWEDFNFDGDFVKEFNDVLEDFYDVGDSEVFLKNGQVKKLCWIK